MNKVLNMFNSIDEKIKKVMKYGIIFCFILTIISCFILVIYDLFYSSPTLYKIGIYIFKNSILFASAFLGFGLVFDKIKKDLF